jgi:hypothetical protein
VSPFILCCVTCTPFHSLHFFSVAFAICISIPFISLFVTHSYKTAIFTHWLLYL